MTARRWGQIALMLVVLSGWIDMVWTGEPKLPIQIANGSYYNACCVLVRLHNGELRAGRQIVAYVVQEDKEGGYVLPKGLVSVASSRLDIDRSAHPLKLRLDSEKHPTRLDIWDLSDANILYRFEKLSGS